MLAWVVLLLVFTSLLSRIGIFNFVVSSKSVGFMVYELKRVISEQFDIYFHLWRDGGANCVSEEEWHLEEEQSWTKVAYEKRKAKTKSKDAKKVQFCEKIVQDSPVSKSVPRESNVASSVQTIKFGSFVCNLKSSNGSVFSS